MKPITLAPHRFQSPHPGFKMPEEELVLGKLIGISCDIPKITHSKYKYKNYPYTTEYYWFIHMNRKAKSM